MYNVFINRRCAIILSMYNDINLNKGDMMKIQKVLRCFKAPNGTMMVDAVVKYGLWGFRKTKTTTLYKCDSMVNWWFEEMTGKTVIDCTLNQYWWKQMDCDSGSMENYLRRYVKR